VLGGGVSRRQARKSPTTAVETIDAAITEMAAGLGDDRISGALARANPAP
jgi:hypothetical protein